MFTCCWEQEKGGGSDGDKDKKNERRQIWVVLETERNNLQSCGLQFF